MTGLTAVGIGTVTNDDQEKKSQDRIEHDDDCGAVGLSFLLVDCPCNLHRKQLKTTGNEERRQTYIYIYVTILTSVV